MVEALSMLSGLAVGIVEAKYPKEFNDRRCAPIVFEVVELVGEELAAKNIAIFVDPFLNQLVDVKDLAYGDKDRTWFTITSEGIQRIPDDM